MPETLHGSLESDAPASREFTDRQGDFRPAELADLLHPETWEDKRPRGRVHLIVGLGHGDEGKGKITQFVGQYCNFGMRSQGGKNAGHTMYLRFDKYNLRREKGDDEEGKEINTHQVPSTAVLESADNYIGPDVWLDLDALEGEINYLNEEGFNVGPKRLGISNLASLVFPHHIYEDELKEKSSGKLGSTKSGIAFVARDEALHEDIRANVILQENAREILLDTSVTGLRKLGKSAEEALEESIHFVEKAMKFKPYIRDVINEVHALLKEGKNGVIEGAQGTGLDRRKGKHKQVTSSGTTSSALIEGAGLSHKDVGITIGVAKAFPSKVGGGEFPERISDEKILEVLAGEKGAVDEERGKTTDREREIGWLSIPVLRKYVELNGVDELAITKWDKLRELGKVVNKFCVVVAYEKEEEDGSVTRIDKLPDDLRDLKGFTPKVREFDMSGVDISGMRSFEELPDEDIKILSFIAKAVGVRIGMLGVGPRDDQIIVREDLRQALLASNT